MKKRERIGSKLSRSLNLAIDLFQATGCNECNARAKEVLNDHVTGYDLAGNSELFDLLHALHLILRFPH